MKKALSVITNLSTEAQDILRDSGISVEFSVNNHIPNTDEVIELLQEYDILIIGVRTLIEKEVLEHINSPKVIATLSIGTDHIADEIKNSDLISVISIKDANAISVAEHIFALILSLNKRVCESNKLVLDGKGIKTNLHERPDDISRKKLGLIGAGTITKEVIKIAKVFRMEVSCWTRNTSKHKDFEELGVKFEELDDVLRESDIINVSLPLTEETSMLISKEKIDLMKPTATFINTSRVNLVDNEALIEKACRYETFYVGLDIDVDNNSNLFSEYRNNVIVTPHTAGVSKQAIERMDYELATKIRKHLEENSINEK